MSAITQSHFIVWGALPWAADTACCYAVYILCTLPWRISVFDSTNKDFHFDGIHFRCACVFFRRQICLLWLWVEPGDRLRQTKSLLSAVAARFPFPVLKAIKMHCLSCLLVQTKRITLQNLLFHAPFSGNTTKSNWHANRSEATRAWV